jgi:Tfp pilus assembly protein PilV
MPKSLAAGRIFKMINRIQLVRQQGQGLIEILMTVLFIGIGVVALIKLQNYLSNSNDLAYQRSDAVRIATRQVEILRDFQVINNTSGYTSYQGIATGSTTVTGANTTYTVSWTVTSYTNPTYKVINITVSWTDRYNEAQSVNMVASVAGIDPSSSATIM